jgi:hypothetical protein
MTQKDLQDARMNLEERDEAVYILKESLTEVEQKNLLLNEKVN